MLTYALRTYDLVAFDHVALDEFGGLEQVLAEILIHGVNLQRKRGLEHDYNETRENLQFIRGRLHAVETALNRSRGDFSADCTFDEYTVDTFLNQILKLTMIRMLSMRTLSSSQKFRIRRLLPYFELVSDIPPHQVTWGRARFDRNNATYRLLIHVAYMLLNDLGMTTQESPHQTHGLEIKNMPLLFQYFVLNYFKKHFPELCVRSERQLHKGIELKSNLVPILKPDIMLEMDDVAIIIDTKFYRQILPPNQFGQKKLRAEHRNQILTYTMHANAGTDKDVSGMLLYAQTRNESSEDVNFHWKELGAVYSVRTVDLGSPFEEISSTLDELVYERFPSVTRVS